MPRTSNLFTKHERALWRITHNVALATGKEAEELLGVAYDAFLDCVRTWEETRGAFITLLYTVVRRRLYHHLARETLLGGIEQPDGWEKSIVDHREDMPEARLALLELMNSLHPDGKRVAKELLDDPVRWIEGEGNTWKSAAPRCVRAALRRHMIREHRWTEERWRNAVANIVGVLEDPCHEPARAPR